MFWEFNMYELRVRWYFASPFAPYFLAGGKKQWIHTEDLVEKRLTAEASLLSVSNTVKYRVEEMRPKRPFWKHCAPKLHLVEAQCAHWKHC